TSNFQPGESWYVYDLTTGENAVAEQNDLSNWNSPDANQDSDGDGLVDWYELLIGTNPYDADTDHDGIPDGWEIRNGLNPLDSSDASLDFDGDGLTNLQEYQVGTNPRVADTDGDGVSDGQEVQDGTDPLRAGRWIAVEFRVEAGRAGHSFSLKIGGHDFGSL